MFIQDVHTILTEYNNDAKNKKSWGYWWQWLFGPPTIIKQIKLFLDSLAASRVPLDLARRLTDEEMFRLYHILLSCEKPEIRRIHGLMYEQEQKGGNFDPSFETCLSFSIKDVHVRNAARAFYKHFPIALLETLLENKNIMTQRIFTAIQKHPESELMRTTIEVLKDSKLLSESNIIALTQHPHLE